LGVFFEVGGMFIDIVVGYGDGVVEELFGYLFFDFSLCEDVVLCMKVGILWCIGECVVDILWWVMLVVLDGLFIWFGIDYVDFWFVYMWCDDVLLDEMLLVCRMLLWWNGRCVSLRC